MASVVTIASQRLILREAMYCHALRHEHLQDTDRVSDYNTPVRPISHYSVPPLEVV
jgi:hypothetical protein